MNAAESDLLDRIPTELFVAGKWKFTGSTEIGVRLLEQADGGVLRDIGHVCTAANHCYVHEVAVEELGRRVTERLVRAVDPTGRRRRRGCRAADRARGCRQRRGLGRRRRRSSRRSHRIVHSGQFRRRRWGDSAHRRATGRGGEPSGDLRTIVADDDVQLEEQAIKLAASSPGGLVGDPYIRDDRRGQRLIEEIETGLMALNVGLVSHAVALSSGVKPSGLGCAGSREEIQEYLETKYALMPAPYA